MENKDLEKCIDLSQSIIGNRAILEEWKEHIENDPNPFYDEFDWEVFYNLDKERRLRIISVIIQEVEENLKNKERLLTETIGK